MCDSSHCSSKMFIIIYKYLTSEVVTDKIKENFFMFLSSFSFPKRHQRTSSNVLPCSILPFHLFFFGNKTSLMNSGDEGWE